MSKFTLIHTLRRELTRVNSEIDMKIVQGRSYTREARRHRSLLAQLYRLNNQRVRTLGIFSFF